MIFRHRLRSHPHVLTPRDPEGLEERTLVRDRALALVRPLVASRGRLAFEVTPRAGANLRVSYLSEKCAHLPLSAEFPVRTTLATAWPIEPTAELVRRAAVVQLGNIANAVASQGELPWLSPGPVGSLAAYRSLLAAPFPDLHQVIRSPWRCTCAAVSGAECALRVDARWEPLPASEAGLLRTLMTYLHETLGPADERKSEIQHTLRALVTEGGGWRVRIACDSDARLTSAVAADWGPLFAPAAEFDVPVPLHATLFTSAELEQLIMPPWGDGAAIPGMRHHIVHFAVAGAVRPAINEQRVRIGVTRDAGNVKRPVDLVVEDLARHTVVFGSTGTGKTTTVLGMLDAVRRTGRPFLVIDPIKRDYSERARIAGWSEVRHYDFRYDRLPRFNPFLPPPGVPAADYAGVLAAALVLPFASTHVAFAYMRLLILRFYEAWQQNALVKKGNGSAPIPLRALTRDVILSLSPELPTFEEFLRGTPTEIQQVVPKEFRTELAREKIDFFLSRIKMMRHSMLAELFSPDDPATVLDPLFNKSAIVELEAFLEPSEADAVAGLLVAQLAIRRRGALPGPSRLAHLLVLEEAHRLLPRPQGATTDTTMRGTTSSQLGDLLSNLLAESRSAGQGLVCVEQRPSRLRTDAIANAATFIGHQLYEQQDQNDAMKALGLPERHGYLLNHLPVGHALVRSPQLPVAAQVHMSAPPTRATLSYD